MSRPPDTLAARLKLARTRAGFTQTQLAKLSGMKQPDISKIELGDILKTTGIARLSQALGVLPEWLELGNGPMAVADASHGVAEPGTGYQTASISSDPNHPLAQAVSQRQPIVAPLTMVWEDLVSATIEGQFLLAVRGEALMPIYPPGQMAIWQACDDTAANPGQAVLLKLPGDRFELRFLERRGSTWAGISQRVGFGELQPERDGATVVARLRYLDLG